MVYWVLGVFVVIVLVVVGLFGVLLVGGVIVFMVV